MKRGLYLRLFFFSILGALTLSLISLYCLARISEMVVEDYRYGYLLYIARSIERSSDYQPVSKINVNKVPTPPVKDVPLTLLDGPAEEGPRRSSKPSLWLVSEKGRILSTNSMNGLPAEWEELPRPKKIHGIESNEDSFLFKPKTFIMKLDTEPTTFLVSYTPRSPFYGPFLWIQGIHTFTTAALAVFLALSISFYYLRRKSSEARKVLGRLGSGDLKARFEIKRFDEFGNLLLDFNRMADEIERLVKRVNDTEASRSNLLQELGHDLRTPLTSLTTSIETLKFHLFQITDEERNELFSMIGADIHYFKDLLEKLTIVATIDEPHYKASTEKIELTSLLQLELKSRQTASGEALRWEYEQGETNAELILGDTHLITRLFKNALDNASRFAKSTIRVKLTSFEDSIEVFIMDDGPGLTSEALDSFGKRRERRQRKEASDFSLGLGSVIMKIIAEVHGGSIEMSNLVSRNEIAGACLKVRLQKI